MTETNKTDAAQPLDLEALKSHLNEVEALGFSDITTDQVLALIAEVERLRVANKWLTHASEMSVETFKIKDAQNARLKAALEPFGELAPLFKDWTPNTKVSLVYYNVGEPTWQKKVLRAHHFTNAATAMKGE